MTNYLPGLLDIDGAHQRAMVKGWNKRYTGSKTLITSLSSDGIIEGLAQGARVFARPYGGELNVDLHPSPEGNYMVFDPTGFNHESPSNAGFWGINRDDLGRNPQEFFPYIIHETSFIDHISRRDRSVPVTADLWQKAGGTGFGNTTFCTIPYSTVGTTTAAQDSVSVTRGMAMFMNTHDVTGCTFDEWIDAAKLCLESSTGGWNMFEGFGVFDVTSQDRITSYLQGNVVVVYGQNVQGITATG